MKTEEVILDLLKILSKHQINQEKLIDILAGFIYSIGESLEGQEFKTSEEVLMEYAKNPTLGIAMMAQGLWMRDNWKTTVELYNSEDKIHNNTNKLNGKGPINE